MQYDVFISYSSVDQKIAEGVCAYLEQHGIRCFVAYRDIPRGVVWAAAIVDALENARMMLVLFSRHFNESRQVDREIELAAEQDIPILTFRLSDAAFTGAKKYYLKNLNWIDAFPNPEQCFGSLKNNVCLLLNIPSDGAPETEKTSETTTLYMVRLASAGAAKLQVVKVVKESLGIGLKEAKDLVDNAPCELPNTYSFEEASLLKNVLEDAGATAVLLSSTMGMLPSSAQCYLELQSASPFNKDFLTRYTSFSAQEISTYISSVPCILPYLYDTSVAAGLKASLEREGAKVRLIPYDENSRSVGFKILTTGTAKLQVVKCLKELLEIDLKRAKELADAAPAVVATAQDMKEALWFADGLREAGAVVSVVLQ